VNGPRTRQIGGDRVVLGDDRLTVVSHVDMAGWDVRKHRPSVIVFDGRTWRVTGKAAGPEKTIRYELQAWRPGDHDLTGPEIDYSPDFVALRDYTIAVGRQRSRVTGLLGIVAPLTGFLSVRAKARLETVYGIDPMASTFRSVLIEGFVAFAGIVLHFAAYVFHGLPSAWFLPMAAVAGIDAAVRWDRILDEERPPPGFYEWLFRRRPST
jgi:hypothetical protein